MDHRTNIKENLPGRVTRYAAFTFAILAVFLLGISFLFFISARQVQQDYNQMVTQSLQRLELINSLHHNEDIILNAASRHLHTSDLETKEQLELEIEAADDSVLANLQALQALIHNPGRRQMLETYTQSRRLYIDSLRQLLTYSRHLQDDTHQVEDQQLALQFFNHQEYLNQLGDTITLNTKLRGQQALNQIEKTIQNYNLLLLAALLVTMAAAYQVWKIMKRLQSTNKVLSTEIQERQQLEQALHKSNQLYKTLFDNIPVPMWVYDQKSLQFLEVNDAALQEYGYTRDEFMAMQLLALQPKQYREELKEKISAIDEQHFKKSSLQHQRKDDSTFYVDIKSHALPADNEHKPRVVVAVNVHERVLAQQELERREKQLLEVSSSMPGCVYQFQIDKDNNYSFPFISGGIFELYGYTPEEVYKDPYLLFRVVQPEDMERLMSSIAESAKNLTPWIQEYNILNPKLGRRTWIRAHSLPTLKEDGTILYNGTLIDITEQKETQLRLVQSKANLTALLDSSPQAIYLIDKDLKVLSFNKVAANEVRVLQLKELKAGQSMLEYVATHEHDTLIQDHQQAMLGRTVLYETGCGNLWFEVAFRPVFTEDNQTIAVALSIHDITEQRNIVKAIKDSESQLSRSQVLAKAGSWEYDIERDILTLSQNMFTIYGTNPETFTPTFNNVLARFHPEDKGIALQVYQEVLDNKDSRTLEHRIQMPDGNIKYLYHIMEPVINAEGRVTKVLGTTQDVTEQKEREKEITETKNRFISTIENIPEIILSADPELHIFYISPQCYELTGYTEEEFTRDHLWPEIIHPDDLPLLHSRLVNEVLAGHKLKHEMRILTKSGVTRWMMLRMSPKLDNAGKVVRLDSSIADITEYKQIEHKRAILTEKLQLQNQNLQQFAYIVSHNLRAPIANILGLTSIYDKNQPDSGVNQRVIENLTKSARQLDTTIRDLNDLLTMRSEAQQQLEVVTFRNVYQHVTEMLSDEINKSGAVIDYDFSAVPTALTVKSYLESILHNLISNALKYRADDRKLQVNVKTLELPEYICLQVSDNGLGIDLKKEKNKVFGLYKRFHPHIAGKGLGLHLVKTQAELLGGKVEVESAIGAGTTFSVYFLKSNISDEYITQSSFN